MQTTNKRKEDRIMHPFNLRYRQIDLEETAPHWDASIARNISKNGIFFNASKQFVPGAEIELKLNHPGIDEKDNLLCLVVRSNPSATLESVFETAVFIYNANENARKSFDKTMNFFLDQ
ncbi:PilZ domain-containing protein [Candidatus Omnitrophota bacterium]